MPDDHTDPSKRAHIDPESAFSLIERARAGDEQALERLFARHLRRIERDLEPCLGKGVVKETMKSYRVVYERDESGWWVASVRSVRGCHTQGRTVEEARRRIVEALELFVDHAHKATLVDEVKLPTAAARAVRAFAVLRKKAEQEYRRAALAARRAVRVLRSGRLKMSARDAARLLGLSHQRVHQLTQHETGGRRAD